MFSARFHWNAPQPAVSACSEKRCAGARILDLTESNPTHPGLRYPDGIVEAFRDPRMLSYEPLQPRNGSARGGQFLLPARGHVLPPERVLLTASTSEAYAYLFKLLADPGDEILVPRPSYPF